MFGCWSTFVTRHRGTISTICTANSVLIQETIPVKRFYNSTLKIIIWGLMCPWFIYSPNLGSNCLKDTIIIIAIIIIIVVVIISLVLYFLSILFVSRILRENVVIVLAHWICTRSLVEEFRIGVDIHQCLGFVNPKAVATFVVNK